MLNETILTLIRHNNWYEGQPEGPVDPAGLKEAIDHAIRVLMQVENLIKQRGRHNTEIAYKGLEIVAGQ